MNNLLSVGIPSYNNPKRLLVTLKALLTEAVSLGIRITVLDESEEENAQLRELVQLHPEILILVRRAKTHLDEADNWLAKKSPAKYIWLVGDDIPLYGALTHIHKVLSEHRDISILWVNGISPDGYTIDSERGMALYGQNPHLIDDPSILIEQVGDNLTFISSLCFNAEQYSALNSEYADKVGTCMAYLYHLYHLLAIYKVKSAIIYEPCYFSDRRNLDKAWYPRFEVFCINYSECLDHFCVQNKRMKSVIFREKRRRARQIFKGVILAYLIGRNNGLTGSNIQLISYALRNLFVADLLLLTMVSKAIFYVRKIKK